MTTTEAEFRDTCRAIAALEPLLPHRQRRAVAESEMRQLAILYLAGELTIQQIADRLNRPKITIMKMLRTCEEVQGKRRKQGTIGPQKGDSRRRSAKITEAIFSGDSEESIQRRWGLTGRRVHEIAEEYRQRFFGRNVHFKLTCPMELDDTP